MSSKIIYPEFKTDDCSENMHGQLISDPYRWLEDPNSSETKKFVEQQNEITFSFINQCKYRPKIIEKLTELWNYPIYGCISEHGKYFYYYHNSGLQNQSVLYQIKSLNDEPKVFLNPNEWSNDGTVSLKFTSFSKDGKYFAYGISESGHDWIAVKFMEVETRKVLPDQLDRIKFSNVQWTHDNKGVFYSGYLEQEGVKDGTETTTNINQKLRYHKMGTSQNEDILCYDLPDQPTWMIGSEITECGNYLLAFIYKGTDPKCKIYFTNLSDVYFNVTERLQLIPLVNEFEAKYDYVTNIGTKFLFLTNKDASMQKVVKVDIENMKKLEWVDVIPTNDEVLLNWAICANKTYLIVCFQLDVADSVSIFNVETGEKLKNIDFPLGTIDGCSAENDSTHVFFKYTSYLNPGISYHYDLCNGVDGELEMIKSSNVPGINLTDFICERIFYSSKDGTKIPLFIVRHKDTVLDGTNPCHLYGYGGFDISIKPGFSKSQIFLMQYFRFVTAIANIRGGGEYGEKWHNGGRLMNKLNCFIDFIEAAKYLVDNKYTCSQKLVIEGGSNGGLLVAACMNMNPDQFGCVISHVGVLDILRFHKFTIGHAWKSDFGDPEQKEDFEYIIKYSPLHNIQSDKQYPACLLLSADHDDRVVPLHTMKFLATLQKIAAPYTSQPLVARFDVKSGHGAGKPTSKRIEEVADVISFMQVTLGFEWKD